MSESSCLLIWNPARFLPNDLREAIAAAGVMVTDRYAAAIDSDLRRRGEHALAEPFKEELASVVAEGDRNHAK